ncbi:MAG: bacteriohemerythrin [Treponema sp.]|jgi:hemerythrin-like metal-binding protein|nr:bacteriohemerythrin [Treponema sp.]
MDEDSVFWDDAFSVNFELIDNQHKELVRMTNTLFMGCKAGSTAADVAFMKTIRSAVEYAQTHFYTEEKHMQLANYPDLEAHKGEHSTFVSTVVKAVKEFEEGNSEPIALARFLKQWLLNHIAKSDKKYAPYLAKL